MKLFVCRSAWPLAQSEYTVELRIIATFCTEMDRRLGEKAEVLCTQAGWFQRLSERLARVGDAVTPTSRGR
jgi:hypothetical protein